LEDRLAPATHTWTGATSGDWNNNMNWTGNAPTAGETNVVLNFPAAAANLTNNNNIANLTIQTINFTGSGYTLGGMSVTLTGGVTADNTVMGTDTINLNITLGGAQTVTVTNAAGNLVLGGTPSGPAAAGLTKVGAGKLVLAGNNTAYLGSTTLSMGTLGVSNNNALGTGTLALNDGTTFQAEPTGSPITLANAFTVSGTAAVGGANALTFITGMGTLTSNTTVLNVTNTATTTFSGPIGGMGGINANAGTGRVVLSNNTNNYAGGTTLTSGTLEAGSNGALGAGALNLNGGTFQANPAVMLTNNLVVNGSATIGGSNDINFAAGTATLMTGTLTVTNSATTTFNRAISGPGALVVTAGNGTVTLGGPGNSYTGGTTVNSGVLIVGNNTALGAATAAVTLNGGSLHSNTAVTLGNNFTAGGAATIDGSNPVTINGTVTLSPNTTLTVNNTAATITLAGNVSGAGALTKSGGGTLALSGANNTYTGPTMINGGTLQQGALNAVPSGSAVTVGSGAMFNLNNFNDTIASLTGAGMVMLGSGTLTVGDGTSTTFSGMISGTGGLTKVGTGTLNLTSPSNTYTGTTAVMAGTLLVNSVQGSSNVTVAGGATLGGSGTVGALTATGSGTATAAVSPGGPGTAILTASGNVVFNANSAFTVKLNGTVAGSGYDQLIMSSGTGTVNLAGSPTLNVTAMPPAGTPFMDGTTFTIIMSSGPITGTFNNLPNNAILTANGLNFRITYNTNSVVLTRVVSATTTSLTSSANPSVFGQSVTLTATVTSATPGAGTPTQTVTFQEGQTTLGSSTLDSTGRATFVLANLSVGAHTLTAVYNGDTNFRASTSTPATQTVNQAATTTTLTASAGGTVFGQPVTLTATVNVTPPGSTSAGTPGGTVIFRDGTTTLGSTALNASRQAALTTTALTAGSHTITAVYTGDTNFSGSTSSAVTQTVGQASTTTIVTSSLNPSVFGQSVTFTASVGAVAPGSGTPTGTVTFMDGTTALGTPVTLTNGQATFMTATLSSATHPITAVYSGDSNFAASTSPALTQSVSQVATTTTLTSSANPAAFGQSVTFTATVAAVAPGQGTPTGTVTFREGTTTLGTGTLANGSATLTTTSLAAGSHTVTANYASDGNFASSTSAAVTQTINKSATTTTLTFSPSNPTQGQQVTFTATVAATAPGGGTPTGTVTFNEGSTALGTATLNATGVATFNTSTLSAGTHSITAAYGGDNNFNASTSAAVTVTVAASVSNPTITSLSPTSAVRGSADVTLTVTGTNFANNSTVQLNGMNLTTTFVSATRLTAIIPAANLVNRGTLSITVSTPGGATSNAQNFTVTATNLPDGTRGTPSQRTISEFYHDLLGRPVDPSGLATFAGMLDSGTPRQTVFQIIQHSLEYKTKQVRDLYARYLRRAADDSGLTVGLAFLARGGTVEQLAAFITGSQEYFQTRGGGTSQGFLNALYQDALNRAIDGSGQTTYSQALTAGVTREQVAAVLFAGTEYQQNVVQNFYRQFLGRNADPGGLATWTGFFQQQQATDEQILSNIVGDPGSEYFNQTSA
jgi:autotransporter-associated beta strand protein